MSLQNGSDSETSWFNHNGLNRIFVSDGNVYIHYESFMAQSDAKSREMNHCDLLWYSQESLKYFNKNLCSKISLENFLIFIVRHFQTMTFKNTFYVFIFFWGIQSRSNAANRTEQNMWVIKCPLKPDWDLWKLKDPEEAKLK